jgi:hypothetical protein
MPRGPGQKKNYNLDYSRFNFLDKIEDDEPKVVLNKPSKQNVEATRNDDNQPDMSEITNLLRNMPPELQEAYRMMSIAKETGDEAAQKRANELALKAVEHGGPEVKKNFLSNLSAQAPELGARLGDELGKVTDDPTITAEQIMENLMRPPEPEPQKFDEKVAGLKETMEASAAAAKQQLENLNKQQEELENLKSPEDLMKFMSEGGLNQGDLQRILGGDMAHMEACFKGMLDKAAQPDGPSEAMKKAEEAVKAAETLHDNILGFTGDEPVDHDKTVSTKAKSGYDVAKQQEAAAPVAPPAPPVREVKIPDYRLQYQKDEHGRYTGVELRCTLPGIADMSAIVLDVSAEHLRLSTLEPAPGYVVNAGPFPVPIDEGAARAKFSKKRQELLITVPTKQ